MDRETLCARHPGSTADKDAASDDVDHAEPAPSPYFPNVVVDQGPPAWACRSDHRHQGRMGGPRSPTTSCRPVRPAQLQQRQLETLLMHCQGEPPSPGEQLTCRGSWDATTDRHMIEIVFYRFHDRTLHRWTDILGVLAPLLDDRRDPRIRPPVPEREDGSGCLRRLGEAAGLFG